MRRKASAISSVGLSNVSNGSALIPAEAILLLLNLQRTGWAILGKAKPVTPVFSVERSLSHSSSPRAKIALQVGLSSGHLLD
jgi:hypothetical protein